MEENKPVDWKTEAIRVYEASSDVHSPITFIALLKSLEVAEKHFTHLDIGNAEHPLRQKAIQIIEQVIEPFVEHGINGEEYYILEDNLVDILTK